MMVLRLSLILFILTIPVKNLWAIDENIWQETLNFAEHQVLLSEKIAKEFFFIQIGINVAKNHQRLKSSTKLFNYTLKRLLDDSDNLGLKTVEIGDLKKQLVLLGNYSVQSMHAIVNKDTVEFIKANNKLSKTTNSLYDFYSMKAEAAGVVSGNTRVRLAAWQRILTQKIFKELLLVQLSKTHGYEIVNLTSSIESFKRAIHILFAGDSTRNIPKATDPNLLKRLDSLKSRWREVENFFEKLLQMKSLDLQDLKKLEIIEPKLLLETIKLYTLIRRIS